MMWRLEQEDNCFYIYDSKKNVAGYLDPDFGNIKDDEDVVIERMLRNGDAVMGAFLMLPMVKFEIFNEKYLGIERLQECIESAGDRVSQWRNVLDGMGVKNHWIHVSHTDQDMLAVTIPVSFSSPTPLRKERLLREVAPVLDHLQKSRLL